jgi:hypothetical protein
MERKEIKKVSEQGAKKNISTHEKEGYILSLIICILH